MSTNESLRAEILSRVMAGVLTLKQAAQLLGLSYRQVKRLAQRYQRDGSAGLVHRHTGQRSNRAKPPEVRAQALAFVRRKGGDGLRPSLVAAELSRKEGVTVSQETLRRWMLEAGLRAVVRRSADPSTYVPKRHFGELLILRARLCSWHEERRTVNWIMELTDDATNSCGLCVTREPIWALAGVLEAWVHSHGIPRALQIDDPHNIGERTPLAVHLRNICATLGIPLVAGGTRGRQNQMLEAHWKDLKREFRARGISSDTAANTYLAHEYLPDWNCRHATAPALPEDFHRRVGAGLDLAVVFRLQEERPISDRWVVQYRGRAYQVNPESRYAPARDSVTVYEWPDRRLEIHYRGRALRWRQLPAASSPANRQWTAINLPIAGTFLSSETVDISNES